MKVWILVGLSEDGAVTILSVWATEEAANKEKEEIREKVSSCFRFDSYEVRSYKVR